MTVHPLAGEFSVDASARRIRHYRYAEERLMRVMGGWIALTPELPVKLLFGRHVWECAQHADLWGRRLPELRAAAQQSEPSGPAFVAFMDLLESPDGPRQSVERVVGVYRVLKPHLLAVYRRHLTAANPVYEPPTRRILGRCVAEERRHVAAGRVLLERVFGDPGERRRAAEWEARLREALGAARGVTGTEPDAAAERLAEDAALDGDVVALDSRFTAERLEPDLQASLAAHAGAVAAGAWDDAAQHLVPEARAAALAIYRALGAVARTEVTAGARIGAYRFVKMRIVAAAGIAVVQQQWRRLPDGWRIVEAALVRTEPAA